MKIREDLYKVGAYEQVNTSSRELLTEVILEGGRSLDLIQFIQAGERFKLG